MTMPSIGVQVFPADGCITPVDLGRAVEDRDFGALFFPEHLHMPVNRTIGFPTHVDRGMGEVAEIELPTPYKINLDPFVAFGAIAAVTSELALGTGITLVAQRDPILLAKTIATLDHICGGRFILGVGAGWNIEEMRNHGVDPETRWGHARENVEAMREIWYNDVAKYHGRFSSFDEIWSWPKPFAGREIPVLIGGANLERVLRWGDGWIPALDFDVEPVIANIHRFHALARETRPDKKFDVTVAVGHQRRIDAREFSLLAGAGVTRVLFAFDSLPYAETVEALDVAVTTARAAGWAPSREQPIVSA
jgi:probable F420-dependent oxidoreductase